jgi:hypothetical protein
MMQKDNSEVKKSAMNEEQKKLLAVLQRIPNNNMVLNASFATSIHYTPFDSIENGLE